MKKIITILLVMTLMSSKLFAQVPNLVVEVPNDQWSSGVYEHKGTVNQKNYWLGPKQSPNYVIFYSTSNMRWNFGQWYGDTSMLWGGMYSSTTTKDIPTDSWNYITVTKEGPALYYSAKEVMENKSNNGSIGSTFTVRHNKFGGIAFSGAIGGDMIANNGVTVQDVPYGITAKSRLLSDSVLEFYFEGQAVDHALDTSMLVSFSDAAFTNGGKADSTSNAIMKIAVNFINQYTVAKTGGDFDSVSLGMLALKNGDILHIKEGVYTEYDIKTSPNVENIILIGEGPDKTIIQADTIPYVAKGRVFTLQSAKNVYIEGMTIQNGNSAAGNGYAGGIFAQSAKTTILNCRILNNRAFSTSSGQTTGGGMIVGDLDMKNCEVVGNICDNGNKAGQIIGGGVVFQGSKGRIENSTIALNFSRSGGAGIAVFGGKTEIINCTVVDNETPGYVIQGTTYGGEGGGIWAQDTTKIINSIFWNNKGVNGKNVYTVRKIQAINSISGDFSNNLKDSTKMIEGTFINSDPKLDTLKFNCSPTRTFALLEGSPAIDSAIVYDGSATTDQRGFEALNGRDLGSHETNNSIRMSIAADTACTDGGALVELMAYPNSGTFVGEGVTGSKFDPTKITKEGWVVIRYQFSAPGCEDFEAVDSIYAKVCQVNKVKNLSLPVRLYPNPTSGQLNIDVAGVSAMNVVISDMSGKVIFEQKETSPTSSLEVSHLPQGIYFVTVTSEGRKGYLKFIKN
jgi:hypothetical protein